MKIELVLTEGQLAVLNDMGNLYGETIAERVKHVLTDVLATEKRRREAKFAITTPPATSPSGPIWQIPPSPYTPNTWPYGEPYTTCSTDFTSVTNSGPVETGTSAACVCPPVFPGGNWVKNPKCGALSHMQSYTFDNTAAVPHVTPKYSYTSDYIVC